MSVPLFLHLVITLLTLSVFSGIAPARPVANPATDRPVVSGSLASDEVLVALFSDVDQPDVVLSHFADDPAYSNVVSPARRFARRWHNSTEALLALNPRLVIMASFNNPALKTRLAQAKLNTVELQHFNSLSDIRNNIRTIGRAVDREAAAEALIRDMDARLKISATRTQATAKRPAILLYSASATPGGKDTLLDEVITAAGATNLAATIGITGWAKVSGEILAGLQPDYVLVPTGPDGGADLASSIKREPLWRHMQAVKNDRFIFINQAALFSVSHHIASAVEALGRALP